MDWLTAILVLICPYYVSNSGGLTINPDVTAITGESANFICSKQAPALYPVDWYHRPVGHESIIHIYSERGGGFRPEYQSNFVAVNDNDKGIYHLVIKNVTTSLAGTFFCRDNDEYGTTAESDLIVIYHSPTCQTNQEVFIGDNDCDVTPDSIDLTCDVPYIGNRPPKLTWKYRNGTNFNQPALNLNRTVHLKATLSADTVRDGESFVCHVESTLHQCTTVDIKIPQMKTKVVHKQEDFICLESPTTPHCSNYRLYNDSSGNEPAVPICSANCTIRSISCLVTLLRLHSEQDAKESIGLIIGIVVGLCCSFIAVGFFAIACYRKWLCFKQRSVPVYNSMDLHTPEPSQDTNATATPPTQCQRNIDTHDDLRTQKPGNVKNLRKIFTEKKQDTSTSVNRRMGEKSKKQAINNKISLETPRRRSTADDGDPTKHFRDGSSFHGEDRDPLAGNSTQPSITEDGTPPMCGTLPSTDQRASDGENRDSVAGNYFIEPSLPTEVGSNPLDIEPPSNDKGASEDGKERDPMAGDDSGQPLLLNRDDSNTDDEELLSNDKVAHDDREDHDPVAGDDSSQPLLDTEDETQTQYDELPSNDQEARDDRI